MAYAVVNYFNDGACTEPIAAFMKSIVVTAMPSQPAPLSPSANPSMLMTKFNTNFDDGWVSTVTPNYVQVKKADSEIRLYYVNDALDKSRPNTVEPEQFYWNQIAEPNFRSSQLQTWVQVTYPPIYFLEGNAVDKRTGKSCYVALKVVYSGGARVIISISPNQAAFRQAFAHPNDLDRMLTYNRFAITAKDLPGTWAARSGGGVQYYSAYTGNYAGMQASSSTDEFVFNADGTYKSIHRNASTTNGSTSFSGLEYKGRVTVSDWELLATNRVGGKTKKFLARLEAIQNGFLLILTDSDYEPLQYVLFRRP